MQVCVVHCLCVCWCVLKQGCLLCVSVGSGRCVRRVGTGEQEEAGRICKATQAGRLLPTHAHYSFLTTSSLPLPCPPCVLTPDLPLTTGCVTRIMSWMAGPYRCVCMTVVDQQQDAKLAGATTDVWKTPKKELLFSCCCFNGVSSCDLCFLPKSLHNRSARY